MTDLETAIRSALRSRADEVVVRHTAVIRRRRRWLPPTLAAALVIALVAITLVVVRQGDHKTPPATGTQPFVGFVWRLVQIDDPQGRLTLPTSTTAEISFDRTGQMLGSDTVHGLSAHYRLVESGYETDGMASTGNGLAGPISSTLKRTLGAIESCFESAGGDNKPATATPIQASVSGDQLVLHTSYGVLTFVRAGTQPDPQLSASRTSTPS